MHCNTDLEAKLISSRIKHFPFLKASTNGPSSNFIPAHDSLFPIYFPNKSDIVVSELKLNLILGICKESQIISEHNVFDVPVGPSNKTGI